MSNQKSQAKILANTIPRETARFNQGKNIVNGLTDDELAKINSFRDKLEQALRDIVDGEDTQVKVAKRLFPIVKDETKLSKILAYGGSDKRHVNLKLMVALRRVYGLDINKLVDEL